MFVSMGIESTNNAAERAIRPMVIRRKVSGGSRSDAEAETACKLASAVQTLKKRGMDLINDDARLIMPSPG